MKKNGEKHSDFDHLHIKHNNTNRHIILKKCLLILGCTLIQHQDFKKSEQER